jgi:hypothetical protein
LKAGVAEAKAKSKFEEMVAARASGNL